MADNRTEKATPRKRQQAREKGQVLRSRDLISALALFSVILFLAWHPEIWIERWAGFFARCLQSSISSDWSQGSPVLAWTTLTVAQWVTPVFALAFFVSVGASVAQGGVAIASEALSPNFERLNPVSNVQQIFSLSGLSRVLRSLIPSGIIFYLTLKIILRDAPAILHAVRLYSRASLALMGSLCFELSWKSAFVLLAWSAVDYLLQRQTFEKSLRMTKQEVRQESKDLEGNPQIKMRIRRLRRDLLRKLMRKNVARATAVIANPTHYAVAIEYRPSTMVAPVVVAKGRNLIAQKIKELARWHEVPIVENPPLAQALYKSVDVGQMIPPNLYAAVAEILAFLYRAQMRMSPNPAPSGGAAR